MNRATVLVALCRWAPYGLLAAAIAVLLFGLPLPRILLLVLVLACLAVLVLVAWLARLNERPNGRVRPAALERAGPPGSAPRTTVEE